MRIVQKNRELGWLGVALTSDASSFIKGEVVHVDGGLADCL
jgi:enoyl-[acyl-carrier-protein] reductase (NADH)